MPSRATLLVTYTQIISTTIEVNNPLFLFNLSLCLCWFFCFSISLLSTCQTVSLLICLVCMHTACLFISLSEQKYGTLSKEIQIKLSPLSFSFSLSISLSIYLPRSFFLYLCLSLLTHTYSLSFPIRGGGGSFFAWIRSNLPFVQIPKCL